MTYVCVCVLRLFSRRYRTELCKDPSAWLDLQAAIVKDLELASAALTSIAATVASENRLTGQLNLMSGYLTLLGGDAGLRCV